LFDQSLKPYRHHFYVQPVQNRQPKTGQEKVLKPSKQTSKKIKPTNSLLNRLSY